MEKRRFSRVSFAAKSTVETGDSTVEVNLLNISLKGALVQFDEGFECRPGDCWKLCFHLEHSSVCMEFKAVVAHAGAVQAGVKFVETDLNTMIHLRNLMEARTMDPDQVRNELDFLIETDE